MVEKKSDNEEQLPFNFTQVWNLKRICRSWTCLQEIMKGRKMWWMGTNGYYTIGIKEKEGWEFYCMGGWLRRAIIFYAYIFKAESLYITIKEWYLFE